MSKSDITGVGEILVKLTPCYDETARVQLFCDDCKKAKAEATKAIQSLIIQAEWRGRVGEAAWWTKNYQNPQYKDLLEGRLKAMEQRLKAINSIDKGAA